MKTSAITLILCLFVFTYCDGFHKRTQRVPYDSSALQHYLFTSSEVKSRYFHLGTAPDSNIINDPPIPILFDRHVYYWNGYYIKQDEDAKVCRFNITEVDGEIFNLKFVDGTRPRAFFFECRSMDGCCGIKCCDDLSGLLITLGIFTMFFLLILGVLYFA